MKTGVKRNCGHKTFWETLFMWKGLCDECEKKELGKIMDNIRSKNTICAIHGVEIWNGFACSMCWAEKVVQNLLKDL